MKNPLKKFRKKLGYLTFFEFEDAVDKAVEKAVSESRRWVENQTRDTEYASRRESLVESHDDRFALYESHYKDKDNNKEKKKEFEVVESFTGGWNPHLDKAYDQPLQELHRMQQVTLSKYFADPHCRSIIENWLNYTIGGGLKFNVDNEKVEEVIKEFRRNNNMISREKEIIRMGYIEGEVFLAYYSNPDSGDIKIRRIRPQEIRDIETHPEDVENIFAYHWYYQDSRVGTTQTYGVDAWVADIYYDNYRKEAKSKGLLKRKSVKNNIEPNTEIQFIKLGLDNELRGRVPLQPVLRFLKYYEDWLVDRIILNHERSKVVWIKSIKGRGKNEWGKASDIKAQKSPKGGVMLIETDNETYRIESPELNANEAKEDGLGILHAIGAGVNMPIYILNQRADVQNYSSIRKSDTPFSQFIRAKQIFWGGEFEKMYREVIEKKIKAGQLPETLRIYDYSKESLAVAFDIINEGYLENKSIEQIKEEVDKVIDKKPKKKKIRTIDIPLGIEFPDILKEDLKAQADVLKIHKDIGIVSLATLAAKAGYNWKQELHNKMTEKELLKQNDLVEPDPDKDKGDKDDKDNGQDPKDNDPNNKDTPPGIEDPKDKNSEPSGSKKDKKKDKGKDK